MLVETIIDPAELVVVKTLTLDSGNDGVTAETEVEDVIMVEPREFVVENTMTLVDVDEAAEPGFDEVTTVEPVGIVGEL